MTNEMITKIIVPVSGFNIGQQISTTQPLTHSPRSGMEGELEK